MQMEDQVSMRKYEISKPNNSCTSLTNLMPETLELIFSRLSLRELLMVVPSVCKTFEKFLKGPYCWQKINLELWSDNSTPEKIDRMVQMLVNRSEGTMREISVSNLSTDDNLSPDNIFSYIADNAGNLDKLYLKNCDITDEDLKLTATKFSSLTSLCLRNCWEIESEGLEAIGMNCHQFSSLKRMSIYCNEDDFFDFIAFRKDKAYTIPETMPNLNQLGIRYQEMTADEIKMLENEDLIKNIEECQNLEYFHHSDTHTAHTLCFNESEYKLKYSKIKVDRLCICFHAKDDEDSDNNSY